MWWQWLLCCPPLMSLTYSIRFEHAHCKQCFICVKCVRCCEAFVWVTQCDNTWILALEYSTNKMPRRICYTREKKNLLWTSEYSEEPNFSSPYADWKAACNLHMYVTVPVRFWKSEVVCICRAAKKFSFSSWRHHLSLLNPTQPSPFLKHYKCGLKSQRRTLYNA